MRSNIYGDYFNEPVKPLFSFGHGLSYTSFEYSNFQISATQAGLNDTIEISCSVKNTGAMAGDEVVQLYTRDVYGSSPRPVKELKGFVRIGLDPGETARVKFHLPVNLLAFYNLDMDLVIEPGEIQVMIGSASDDIRLSGAFQISGDKPQKVAHRLFVCPVTVS